MYRRGIKAIKESILRKGEKMSKGYIVGLVMTILGYIGIAKFDNIVPAIIFAIGFLLVVSSYVEKR